MSKELIKFPQLSQSMPIYTITFILWFKVVLGRSFWKWKSSECPSHTDQRLEFNLQHHWSGCSQSIQSPQTRVKRVSYFIVMERYQYIRSPSFSSARPKTTIIPMISAPHASRAAAIDSHLECEWSHFQICLKMDEESLLHNDYLSTYLSIPFLE